MTAENNNGAFSPIYRIRKKMVFGEWYYSAEKKVWYFPFWRNIGYSHLKNGLDEAVKIVDNDRSKTKTVWRSI